MFTMLYWFLLYIKVNQLYMNIHCLPPTPPLLHLLGHQRAELSSLCHTACSHSLSVLHMVVYIMSVLIYTHNTCLSICASLSLCPQAHSLCLCLYTCPTDRFISTIFTDSIRTCEYKVFVFLFLTSLCMTDSRFIHVSTRDPISFLFD